jgi:hypothetical protein
MKKQDLVQQENRFYRIARKDLLTYLQAVMDNDERELGETAESVEVIDLTGLTAKAAEDLLAKLEKESAK